MMLELIYTIKKSESRTSLIQKYFYGNQTIDILTSDFADKGAVISDEFSAEESICFCTGALEVATEWKFESCENGTKMEQLMDPYPDLHIP